jgi:hypothetical protein
MTRFFGTPEALDGWREVVAKRTGKTVGPTQVVQNKFGVRHCALAELTDSDRVELMKDWYESAPNAMPWNYRITFEEV